jgi:hypothetical protein
MDHEQKLAPMLISHAGAFPSPKAQVETFLEQVGYGPADRQKIMFGN